MSTNQRIRGRRLQQIREAHFRLHPLCVNCLSKSIVRLAVQLDHIIALTNGGEDIESNRQGLCNPCHEVKTRKDLNQMERHPTGLDGWSTDE